MSYDNLSKVAVSCAHCGNWPAYAGGSNVVTGVPATYIAAGETAHRNSAMHSNNFKKNPGLEEKIEGKMSDFTHGRDHNG